MSVILPPVIAIKLAVPLNGAYFYLMDASGSQTDGILLFNGTNVFSPAAKFEVITAKIGKGLVHIRCSQNKKFLQKVDGDDLIDAAADEPEEDRSKLSCTLFMPRPEDDNPEQVRLFHVNTQKYAGLASPDSTRFSLAYPDEHHQANLDMNIIDLESLVILPKHVAFKGHNENYLTVDLEREYRLRFDCTAKGREETWFEISTDGHGRAQITSYSTQKAWRQRSAGLIFSDARAKDDNTNFWPVKVNNNSIALSSLCNKKFCADVHPTSLVAIFSSIPPESLLVVEELVLSRSIYNTDFDLANSIIYGETPIVMAIANASNSTNADNTVEFKFTHTESKSSTWRTSHSWMASISVEAQLSIPFITDGKVTITAKYSGSHEWGKTITTENTLETTYSVVVKPQTSISVSLMGTKGTCDVPYSYYQKDVLYNGKTVVYKKDDGLYTGINTYKFRYKVATSPNTALTVEQRIPDPLADSSIEEMILLPTLSTKAPVSQQLSPSEVTTQEPNLPLSSEETTPDLILPLLEETTQDVAQSLEEETTPVITFRYHGNH